MTTTDIQQDLEVIQSFVDHIGDLPIGIAVARIAAVADALDHIERFVSSVQFGADTCHTLWQDVSDQRDLLLDAVNAFLGGNADPVALQAVYDHVVALMGQVQA